MYNTLFIVSAIRLSHEKPGLNQVLKKSMLYMVLQQNKCGQNMSFFIKSIRNN